MFIRKPIIDKSISGVAAQVLDRSLARYEEVELVLLNALSANNLGMLLLTLSNNGESIKLFATALAVFRSTPGESHPTTLMAYENKRIALIGFA